jgi:Mrp family chromosome partitioning ATPase/capsular polysaccharide biosynthesis protein
MTLEQYSKTMLKHWRLVVICFVLVGAGAYIGSKLMTPLYQSTAVVEVVLRSGTAIDYNSLSASNLLVQTEATLATSDPVLREVASHYRGLSAVPLSREVTATPVVSTQLFDIAVQDPSPTRAAALANDIAVTLINQQNQLMQQNTANGGSFLVIAQSAQPSLSPASPNKLLYTGAGLLTGLLLGMLLALLFELLDPRVRTTEALTQLLDWPILARIWQATSKNEDVLNPIGHDANVESYRILRTNIGFSAIDKPLRTLVVTSAVPHEGKSVVSANLAIFMARAGKSTLLIDADLRHPIQHEQFGLPAQTMGFSDAILAFSMPTAADAPAHQQVPTATTSSGIPTTPAITRTLSLDPFVHKTDIPNLCIMPSGLLPPNPPELLDSKAMQRFLAALTNCGAEVVIFDTPTLLGLSDARILASKTDGTLVVVDITRAKKRHLKEVKALLEQAGVDALGCVINKQRRHQDDRLFSRYYYGSGEQRSRRDRNKKDANSDADSLVTTAISRQSD